MMQLKLLPRSPTYIITNEDRNGDINFFFFFKVCIYLSIVDISQNESATASAMVGLWAEKGLFYVKRLC